MEKNQIHRLLEKYFDGKSSFEEEMILRNHFSSNNYEDAGWYLLKRQFDLYDSARNLSADSTDLEARIIQSIEDYEKQQAPPQRRLNLTRYFVAASIALAITLSGIFLLRSEKSTLSDTFTDPQLAYAETQKTLLFISQKINDGIKPLDNINKMDDATGQLKNLEKIDKSLGMLNLVSFINQSSNMKK